MLEAVVGSIGVLKSTVDGLRHAAIAPLHQGLGLLPVTNELVQELTAAPRRPAPDSPFYKLSPETAATLADWSRRGPVAYLEAELFAGDGPQSAAVWRDGQQIWGPVTDEDRAGPRDEWPFNAALALLGAVPSGRTYSYDPSRPLDLFDEIGLGCHRETAEWTTDPARTA